MKNLAFSRDINKNKANIKKHRISFEEAKVVNMRKEYDIKNLNPRKNPYSKRLKKQITININDDTISYFKSQSKDIGIPYQALINLYLSDCVSKKRKLQMAWA